MGESAATRRAKAIEEFAAVLSGLRDAAGAPSFRAMASRSGAISHTTLHEAVHGYRLPSWGTTAEFVKACGADPADYRERWERASCAASGGEPTGGATRGATRGARVAVSAGAVSAGAEATRPTAELVEPTAATGPTAVVGGQPDSDRARSQHRRLRVVALSGAVVFLATAGLASAGLASVWLARSYPPAVIPLAQETTRLTAADCPVQQQNPPPVPPAHEGDSARFVGDLILTDCTHVRRGETVRKVWRLKNIGTVTWTGYTLRRVDPQSVRDCQTITDIPVQRTKPGALVDIPVEVLVPRIPSFCFVRFTLMDSEGRRAFPGERSVNFQLIVD